VTITINPPSKASTYPQAIITLHWLTVLLIAGVFAAIEIRGYYPKGSDMRGLLTMIHQSLGSLVLLLTVLRIAIRSQTPTPPITPAPPAWQHAIASLTHLILYAALLAMPLLGWLMTSAKGHPIPFFGLSFPPLIGENKELGHTLEEVHEFIGNALYYVIGLHALAALVHHYIHKDNTLTRMLSAAR
jgi:superoxide oxidase